jgi:hypothetical protein
VSPGELDELLLGALRSEQLTPAPRTTDEQFIRRAYLDLAGRLPMPADVKDFLADRGPDKRARLVDRLLDTEEFARHWARYWRSVIAAKVADLRGMQGALAFENWLTAEFQKNTGWDELARAMLTAEGPIRNDEPDKNGAAWLLLSRFSNDPAVERTERTAEAVRLLLGIQIQCAQCHDHPFDQWKQEQFHDLAGYFARVRGRPIRDGGRQAGFELVTLPRGEHEMPGKDNPRRGSLKHPKFLDGAEPGKYLSDRERRRAFADAVTGKDNYWFAAAFVNRVWGELLGQAFYQPVDDLGPGKEAVMPHVLARLAAAFAATGYDVKALFRTVANTEAYQRQSRLGESADRHLHFAAVYPRRLSADALWQSLVDVLGPLGPPPPQGARRPLAGPLAGRFGLEGLFKNEFNFDPSVRPEEVEGSIPQALLLMNNPAVSQRIRASGTNLLARVLKAYPEDDDAVKLLYQRALCRQPSARELSRCLTFVAASDSRAEAFEDVLWSLLNSTEFQTRR